MARAVLVATCDNRIEPEGKGCIGLIRYAWGQTEGVCDRCGGRCGIAVADWSHVDHPEADR